MCLRTDSMPPAISPEPIGRGIIIPRTYQSGDNKGTKFSSNGPDHLTKMAAMTIYGKNL